MIFSSKILFFQKQFSFFIFRNLKWRNVFSKRISKLLGFIKRNPKSSKLSFLLQKEMQNKYFFAKENAKKYVVTKEILSFAKSTFLAKDIFSLQKMQRHTFFFAKKIYIFARKTKKYQDLGILGKFVANFCGFRA